jgi:hypothetical protein
LVLMSCACARDVRQLKKATRKVTFQGIEGPNRKNERIDLLTVAHPVNGACLLIRDEHGTIGHLH